MIPAPATAALRHLLTELARTGHTGAVHVDGTPGGTVYLVAGRIAYVESPAIPGIHDRLVGSGRVGEQEWRSAYAAGSARHEVGSMLVRRAGVEHGELVCHVLATICDAGHAVLQTPDAVPRFVPDERHWLGLVTQVELTALCRETTRRMSAAAPNAAAPNALPRRRAGGPVEARAVNAGPHDHRAAPDYATLKRIRQALKSSG